MDEEDMPSKTAVGPGLPRPLNGLSVEELEKYLTTLKQEIGRVDVEIARRRDVRGAAEALFKRPG
ncbi:Uncharacterized small protein, DUF1192 family [Arboricoccus pini]|uniref:Uncharacterized small protein, DUF1192 family n=1 Tax=Arboricoccus pini TaxID=1963835 RepID=A0A212QXX2_9PROT|nr:DUF1192 domain-containing protein [Arboricoccus pini]SNB64559.1 Uncharacterized small protein, DUF1192 family [Arboricoccus pini]